MTRIKWDEVGKRFYETGVDHVTLYVQKKQLDGTYAYANGVPFNGVSSIEDNPSGAESTAIYADNIKYLDLTSKEDYGLNITSYTSPEEFDECDGTKSVAYGLKVKQQTRSRFGLVWRTNIGNDTEGNDYGYRIHIAYNLKAAPSTRTHSTINDSPEAQELSWECTTTDVVLDGMLDVNGNPLKGAAKFEIDTNDLSADALSALEDKLFGGTSNESTLPEPKELAEFLESLKPSPSPEPTPTPTTEVFVAVTPVGTENPANEGWYEYTGSGTPVEDQDPASYTLTEDETVNNEKTYYKKEALSNETTSGGEG